MVKWFKQICSKTLDSISSHCTKIIKTSVKTKFALLFKLLSQFHCSQKNNFCLPEKKKSEKDDRFCNFS